ncbi:cytochrome b [Variovorax sp. RT4R15]|uniref:cytochrome b n=1 Tax=Variovorax sp. RT4R15 TaxID=3443737 RepID=UPI003F44F376
MRWRNTLDAYGGVSMLFHWVTAAAFITAYVVVYYVIWFVDPQTSIKPPLFGIVPAADRVVPILNIHWVLGITIGFLALPRLLWRILGTPPSHVPGSRLENRAADVAHWALYALLFLMPLSGYMTTYDATDFGLFVLPACRDTTLAGWIRSAFALTTTELEDVMWIVHSFLGKRVAWALVALHVAAALIHHFVRRDTVLRRMLPIRNR